MLKNPIFQKYKDDSKTKVIVVIMYAYTTIRKKFIFLTILRNTKKLHFPLTRSSLIDEESNFP